REGAASDRDRRAAALWSLRYEILGAAAVELQHEVAAPACASRSAPSRGRQVCLSRPYRRARRLCGGSGGGRAGLDIEEALGAGGRTRNPHRAVAHRRANGVIAWR